MNEQIYPFDTAAMEARAEEVLRQWQVPGLSVAVASPENFWTAGFGFADVENAVPATANTVYRLASIAKPITATAVLQLFEQGRLDLDAPVQEYVPTFPVKTEPITARLLLAHLSGIRDVAEAEIRSMIWYPPGEVPITTFLEGFQNDLLLHDPGTKFRYTTHGYNLLGAIIESVAGTSYLRYVQENIFQVAGMAHTYADDAQAIIPHRARGYVVGESGLRNADFTDTSNHLAGGGFCGTAGDVARFGRAWQSGKLLKPETMQLALTRQRTKSGQDTRFGLGWFTWNRNGETEIAHGGKHIGASAMLHVQIIRRVVVAILTNLQGISSPQLLSLAQNLADLVDKPQE